MAGVGEALVAVDHQGVVTTFNHAAEELTGVPAPEAVGREVDEVLRLDTGAETGAKPPLSRPSASSWSAFSAVVRADGSSLPVAVSAGPLRGAGGALAGAVYVIRDVRREREVERMKSEFLSNISHELRTPLTPIKGYADLLRRRDVPAGRAKEFVEGILASSERLERVIDLLVSFAALEAGRLPLHVEPVKVRELLDSVAQRWKARADGAHALSRRVERGVGEVALDRQLIERSLDELVDTALKYSPAGGPVAIEAQMSSNGGGPAVVISVRDRGVGIPAERLESLFGEFSQGDGSTTRQYGGLGLGLAFVRRIAQAHDGDLVAHSELGRGSRFSIVLPAGEPGRRSRSAKAGRPRRGSDK